MLPDSLCHTHHRSSHLHFCGRCLHTNPLRLLSMDPPSLILSRFFITAFISISPFPDALSIQLIPMCGYQSQSLCIQYKSFFSLHFFSAVTRRARACLLLSVVSNINPSFYRLPLHSNRLIPLANISLVQNISFYNGWFFFWEDIKYDRAFPCWFSFPPVPAGLTAPFPFIIILPVRAPVVIVLSLT